MPGWKSKTLVKTILSPGWEKWVRGWMNYRTIEKRELLRLVLNESTIDGNNKVSINLAIPVEDSVSLATTSS